MFSSGLLKLTVISIEGGVWNIDAAPDMTVDKLKAMTLCHFYSPLECVKVTSNYKLVLVSEKRPLDNNNSVLQEGLRDNGDYCPIFYVYVHKAQCHHFLVIAIMSLSLSSNS
jgi:hypothetical protein